MFDDFNGFLSSVVEVLDGSGYGVMLVGLSMIASYEVFGFLIDFFYQPHLVFDWELGFCMDELRVRIRL